VIKTSPSTGEQVRLRVTFKLQC